MMKKKVIAAVATPLKNAVWEQMKHNPFALKKRFFSLDLLWHPVKWWRHWTVKRESVLFLTSFVMVVSGRLVKYACSFIFSLHFVILRINNFVEKNTAQLPQHHARRRWEKKCVKKHEKKKFFFCFFFVILTYLSWIFVSNNFPKTTPKPRSGCFFIFARFAI